MVFQPPSPSLIDNKENTAYQLTDIPVEDVNELESHHKESCKGSLDDSPICLLVTPMGNYSIDNPTAPSLLDK